MKAPSAALLAIALLAAASPAWAGRRDKDQSQSTNQQAQTQGFVDARMHETMTSIQSSLNTLVTLTRGGEAPRAAAPIGYTAMGAVGAPRPPVSPDPLPIDPAALAALDKTVDIQWNGPAEALLSSIAHQMGYSFSKTSKPLNTRVRMSATKVTAKNALEAIASQLNGKADIKISVRDKSMQLIVR